MRKIKRSLILLLTFTIFGGPLLLAGCNWFEWPAYIFFAEHKRKVKAEYTNLEDQKIAILVAAGPGIEFEYPYARTNIALATAQLIGKNVEGTEFVSQQLVDDYLMSNLNWATLPMQEIGQKFGASRILFIDLFNYTMYETGSVQLLRGAVQASVWVYEMDAENPNTAVYKTQISVLHPEHGPRPSSDTALAQIKMETIATFADKLAKKFYNHKILVRN